MKKAILQAHRGVSTDCPENTMSAFRAAVEQGYGVIELDPKFTKDNQCAVLHDWTVNRTGRRRDGGELPENLPVAELTLAETHELEFGSWFSPAFFGEEMPLFGDVLALSRASGVPLKVDNVIERFTSEQRGIVFDEIRRAGLAGNIGITCTSPLSAREAVEGGLRIRMARLGAEERREGEEPVEHYRRADQGKDEYRPHYRAAVVERLDDGCKLRHCILLNANGAPPVHNRNHRRQGQRPRCQPMTLARNRMSRGTRRNRRRASRA